MQQNFNTHISEAQQRGAIHVLSATFQGKLQITSPSIQQQHLYQPVEADHGLLWGIKHPDSIQWCISFCLISAHSFASKKHLQKSQDHIFTSVNQVPMGHVGMDQHFCMLFGLERD